MSNRVAVDKNTDEVYKVLLGQSEKQYYYPIKLDETSHTVCVLDHNICVIHEQSAFSAYYSVTTAATNGHRSGLYIKTPTEENGLIHLIAQFAASTAADFSICEAPTIAANTGTHAVAIFNRYRASLKTSKSYDNAATPAANKVTTLTEAQIAGDGTWATGTVIREEPMKVGIGPKPAGGAGRDTQEYVLSPDTKYVFLLTNTAALANTHHILIDWHEH